MRDKPISKFIDAKVVGRDSVPKGYFDQTVKRGDEAYVMSRSELMDFAVCPAKWIKGYRREATKDMKWGSLVDMLVLTPTDFESRYVLAPLEYPAKGRKKDDPVIMKPWTRRATYCQEWEEEHGIGKTVLDRDEYEAATKAVEALNRDAVIRGYLSSCYRQMQLLGWYVDADTKLQVPVQALIDLVPMQNITAFNTTLADFKTTENASSDAWEKHVFHYNLDAQAALYLDLYNAATGEDRTTFCHIVQENYEPYQTARRILTDEFLQIGRLKYQSALERYCRSLRDLHWPDYDEYGRTWNGWRFCEPQSWMLNAA